MEISTFHIWLEQQQKPVHIPDADRLLLLIRSAGTSPGISRKRLGHVIDLEPRLLDQLLAALVQLGQVSVFNHAVCGDYYRATNPVGAVGENLVTFTEGRDTSNRIRAVETVVDALRRAFSRFDIATRKLVWKRITTRWGQELIDRLLRNPYSSLSISEFRKLVEGGR